MGDECVGVCVCVCVSVGVVWGSGARVNRSGSGWGSSVHNRAKGDTDDEIHRKLHMIMTRISNVKRLFNNIIMLATNML